MNLKSICIAVAALTAFVPAAIADDFDFNSQRGEKQEYNPVDGKKLDHAGLVINPTPQSLVRGEGVLDTSRGFTVAGRRNEFAADLAFLPQSKKGGVKLDIRYGAKEAAKAGVKAEDGAYLLTIGKKGVSITGYNANGAYYGIRTLEQIVKSDAARGGLPYLTVNDYPSLKYRGIVEGFYGTPWSHAVRLDLIDFLGANKMNNYLYGPKDDPYHSSPYWRLPYPEDEAAKIRELVEASKRNHVDFVWAIHPGKDIRWTPEDYDSLVTKLDMMYDLGVRHFALFFDDIEGIGTDPNMQVKLVNDLTRDFVDKRGDVGNIIICPTDYSQLWAKPGPEGPLATYGRGMTPKAEVMWTGAVVCSDLTPETLEFINSRIKRPALYWWNYPVTDYARHIMLQGPVYGLDQSLTSAQVAGIESNPMEHGSASKLALYGVGDYAWNVAAYNPLDNWERGLAELMPEAAEAYRNFAIHSADTETGYRRAESWETEIFPFDNYTAAQYDALKADFEKAAAAPAAIRKGCADKQLLKEIDPWLTQLEGVAQRGLRTLALIKTFEKGDDAAFWRDYLANTMSEPDKKAYEAHKVGTMKLHPFYEDNMEAMLQSYYKRISGRTAKMYKGVGSYANLRTQQPRMMLDGDTTTFYTSAYSQADGDWIGVDLGTVRAVDEVLVHQGRNSVDDGDYFERVVLQASPDGKNWASLTDSLERTYIIEWAGEPVEARYVRLLRLPSKRNSWAAVRSFRVNPISEKRVGLNVTAADPTAALRAFDDTPETAFNLSQGDLAFDRATGAGELIMLCGNGTELTVDQLDAKGKVIASAKVSDPFSRVAVETATKRFIVKGKADIYEAVQH